MKKTIKDTPTQGENTINIINRIPNGIHLHTIREALKNGHASVMIGSGFSLNAQGGDKLPTWNQLIDGLLADLYPDERARLEAKNRLGGVSGMLRLAEEYVAVRGRAHLNTRMHELMPDAGVVMPGKLHAKLLSLYWSDIFTTNYDTLLERALDDDRGRFNPRVKPRYQIVVADHDVPYSKRNGRPRIIKLHGSLRTGTRLIVTEDDYRRYPTEFAPFVNTVQQSMLENVFCLIGFSGDDPNFLLWSGWARDHLGDKAPPIYLITLSPISDGQRIILEKRKIFPINVASLSSIEGKYRYARALEALLDFWHEDPPIRRANWPFHNPGNEFKAMDLSVLELSEWVRLARLNKSEYPGWIVAPESNRTRLIRSASCFRILRALNASDSNLIPLWLKYILLDEIVWIYDIAMVKLEPVLIKCISQILAGAPELGESIMVTGRIDHSILTNPGNEEIERIRGHLTFSLMRAARERGDSEEFSNQTKQFNALPPACQSSELRCAFLHQQILFHLENRNKQSAIESLKSLATTLSTSTDPYWHIKAGALYGEVGDISGGYDLVRTGLHRIRDAIQFAGETAFLVSREQWAEMLLNVFNYAIEHEEQNDQSAGESSQNLRMSRIPKPDLQVAADFGTQQEIAQESDDPKDAERVVRNENAQDNIEHPTYQLDALRYEIDIANKALDAGTIKIDSESISDKGRVVYVRNEATDAAETFIRLIERAALPPYIGSIGFNVQTLAACYRILSLVTNPDSSMRILFRISGGVSLGSAETLELPAISELTEEKALEIFDKAVEIINSLTGDKVLERLDKKNNALLKVQLDLASRVVFRLGSQQAKSLCSLAMKLYYLPVVRNDYSLHAIFASFLARATRLLSPKELGDFCFDLLSLSSRDVPFWDRHSWPDVAYLLQGLPILIDRDKQWNMEIDLVLGDANNFLAGDQPEKISDCYTRLDWFYRNGLMKAAQERRFSELIWKNLDLKGIPQIPYFHSAAFLALPSPMGPARVAQIFREWLKAERIEPIEQPSEFMGKAQLTMSPRKEELLIGLLFTKSKNVTFDWTEDEAVLAIEKLRSWWFEEGVRLTKHSPMVAVDFVLPRLRLIAQVIHRVFSVVLSKKTVLDRNLNGWLEEIWNYGITTRSPLVPLLFAGLQWWPDKTADVIDLTIAAINASQDRNTATLALNAAGLWLIQTTTPTEMSRRYVSYLVDSIRTGPEFLMDIKLNAICELLDTEGKHHFQSHVHSLSVALGLMLQELQVNARGSRFNIFAAPLLRQGIANVLVGLERNLKGASRDLAWVSAREMARSDSLLLVRKSVA